MKTFKNRCVLKNYVIVLRSIFNTTYKEKKQVEIYMWALYQELVLFLQRRNCFQYVPDNAIEGDILFWTTSYVWCSIQMFFGKTYALTIHKGHIIWIVNTGRSINYNCILLNFIYFVTLWSIILPVVLLLPANTSLVILKLLFICLNQILILFD